MGIGAFGPVDVNTESGTFGYILDSPKLAWRHKDLVGGLKKALGIPVGLDTDVNGSCLGEVTYGCAKGLDSVIYITIGTGVGVGVWVNGGLLHGMLHPEGGHVFLPRHPKDPEGGICPYHKNCLEGFASGPAIEARWGKKAVELVDRPEVWELESYYIAQALSLIHISLSAVLYWDIISFAVDGAVRRGSQIRYTGPSGSISLLRGGFLTPGTEGTAAFRASLTESGLWTDFWTKRRHCQSS